ncbi:MAG TPA: MFS transporter [Candidatus Acidoferrales bacterium]|nr:MFS transporter [Candidatus Acidoferrales bacterium]
MLLPASATPDASRLVCARALRGLADGFVSVYLAEYLRLLGLSPVQVGAIVTATLVGSAALTLAVGLVAHRLSPFRVLAGATLLMLATGVGFAAVSDFWPLMVIGFAGTLNPSSGDVSVFLPTEQSILSAEVAATERTALFARYSLGGTLLGAFGALASGLPELIARRFDLDVLVAFRVGFALYGAVAIVIAALYSGLQHGRSANAMSSPRAPLTHSRSIVLRLTGLFALDSFGGGFAVDSMLALWLLLRFDLPLHAAASVFFGMRILSAFSQLLSPRLAARFGLIETMVFTHVPANLFLIGAAFMPNVTLTVALLLLRMTFSQMDVPARQSYVMAVVRPEERAAAASVTNVPRSLATAVSPLLAGVMLQHSSYGWPLVVGGLCKLAYDILLLIQFRRVRPPEES